MSNLFESVTCSRCGGTGHYSYCASYGTTCFKCAGRKEVLTKRGAVAQDFYRGLCSVPAADLVVGQIVWDEGGPFSRAGWATVESVETLDDGRLRVATTKCTYGGVDPQSPFRVGQSAEQKTTKRAQALAFQETLTKSGSVRKVKTKGVAV